MADLGKRRRLYLRLRLAEGVGALTAKRLLEAFGDVEAVFSASPAEWRRVEGIGEKTSAGLAAAEIARMGY